MESTLDTIINSQSFEELQMKGLLPEPYSTSGFFYVYFAKEDYKTALVDILQYADAGERVWYDNHLNYGESWEEDMLMKAKDMHCRAIVLYLSINTFRSEFFWKLCKLIDQKHLPYCSVNMPNEGCRVTCGEKMANTIELPPDKINLAHRLFNVDVTYIPGDIPFDEKREALQRIRQNSPLIYVIQKDYVAIAGIKDLSEESIVVPESVNLNGKDYPVKRIMPYAFANCARLKKISLPDSIECVGDPLLPTSDKKDKANNKEKVHGKKKVALDSDPQHSAVPSGGVFYGCKSLLHLRLPEAMKTLYFNNFIGCESLKSLYIGDSVEKVESGSISEFSNRFVLDSFWFDREFSISSSEPEDFKRHFPSKIRLPKLFLLRYDGVVFYPSKDGGFEKLNMADDFDCDNIPMLSGGTFIHAQQSYIGQEDEIISTRFSGDKAIRLLDLSKCADDPTLRFFECDNLEKLILPKKLTRMEDHNPFEDCPLLTELTLPENLQYLVCDSLNQTIHVLISDSNYNDVLFPRPKHAYQLYLERSNLTKRGKKLWLIISPIYMFFKIGSDISRNIPMNKRKLKKLKEDLVEFYNEEYFNETQEEKKEQKTRLSIAIISLLAFPIMYWYLMFRKKVENPFYLGDRMEKIYLKRTSKKPLKLYGCSLVESDKPGYDKYIPVRIKKKENSRHNQMMGL